MRRTTARTRFVNGDMGVSFQFPVCSFALSQDLEPRSKNLKLENLKQNSNSYPPLYPSSLHGKTASLNRFEIDVRARVTYETTDTDRAREHPGDIDAGVEAGCRGRRRLGDCAAEYGGVVRGRLGHGDVGDDLRLPLQPS